MEPKFCDEIRKREKFILQFYNRISKGAAESYAEIPKEQLTFILRMDYKDIIKPLIREKREQGKSLRGIALYFGVTVHCAQS